MNQDQAWIASSIQHIESLAGTPLSADLRRYVEDRLLAVLLDACSLAVRDDDADVLAVIGKYAHEPMLNDKPDAGTALSRMSFQFERFAERGFPV